MNDSTTCGASRRAWRMHGATGRAQPFEVLLWMLLALGALAPAGAVAAAAMPSVAFFYGANPPLDELKSFDIVVVEPEHVADPKPHRREAADGASELFAYVSFGEVEPSRPYFRSVPPGVLKGQNQAWGSAVVDHTAAAWPAFFIERIVAPLWQRGYRGFFLDTMDSYHLIAATPEARALQERAMVANLKTLRERFPGIRLVLNRGFEILPQVKDMVTAVAAESVFQGWDQAGRRYREVPAADREWLLGQLKRVSGEMGLPVIAIDYVPPAERDLARRTARRILDLGFTPWVANPELDTLGVGRVEVVPRRVLVVTDKPEDGDDFQDAPAQRFLGILLNHLGFTYEMRDPRHDPLPEGSLRGRYAGVVSWLGAGRGHNEAKLAEFFRRQIADGVRVAVFNQFPFALDAATAKQAGLELVRAGAGTRLAIASRDAMIGHEREPLPGRRELVPIRAGAGARSLLKLDDGTQKYDAAAIMPWGGYVLTPYSYVTLEAGGQHRWVINPLAFLKAALAPPELPVPDVTTEAGRRILIAHVDGDGWASRAEMPGTPYASEVMLKEVLERFRIPTTVSVIQGETSAQGLFATAAPALEDIARRIYRLPHVEAASHSLSHPFNWVLASAPAKPGDPAYNLALPGYRFDLNREVAGSIDYINRTLVPAGKRAQVFLWTGDCAPPPEAIAATYGAGLLNMNGGDTLITRSNPSWTLIAAQGIRKKGWYQVFAPMQNENVYTNNWTGPFYGFERVIETFELTEKPHRFKPINIYFHTYAASKPASLNALKKAYQYAMSQPVTPLYASDYIRKVLDFESMALSRDTASGDLLVRGNGALRTLRADPGVALPDLRTAAGLAGMSAEGASRYLTLDGAQARLAFPAATPGGAAAPRLADANGRVSAFSRDGDSFAFTLATEVAPTFRLARAERCVVSINGRPAKPADRSTAGNGESLQRYDTDPASLGRAPHQQVVRVRCDQ